MEIAIAGLVVLAFVIANGFATWKVVRDRFAEPSQRVAQVLAVWLIPVLGAVLIFAIHRRHEKPSRQYRSAPDAGDDFAASGQSVRSMQSHLDDGHGI